MRRAVLAGALVLLAPFVIAEPGLYSPNCYQGESFSRVLTWKDTSDVLVNLTGYTAKLQIRDPITNSVVDEFTDTAGLLLGGAAGTITWSMTSTETAALSEGSWVYDLRMTSSTGAVTYLVYGYVNVQRRITR